MDAVGKRLKIPVWMLSPEAARAEIARDAYLNSDSLLNLAQLLQGATSKDRGTFCKRLRTTAREIIMLQLQLLSLARMEEDLVAVEVTVRGDLLDLMARILVTVFQAEEREKNERAFIQSENQAGALGQESHRLLAPIE